MSNVQKQVSSPKQKEPIEVNLVPPKYQPPPQPPATSQGILKPFNGIVSKDNKAYPEVAKNKQYPYFHKQYNSQATSSGVPNLKLYPLCRQQVPYVGVPPPGPSRHSEENATVKISQPMLKIPEEEQLRFPPHVPFKSHVLEEENLHVGMRAPSEETKHIQRLIVELRVLSESNQRLSSDNQELRDLCCFLDDDRQKGRKLAREWQRFGRYTASVMRQEVSAYQNKLRELDNKQQELIKDNLELKELCLYLDEERCNTFVCSSCGNTTNSVMRDDGDGSSSSTNADEPRMPQYSSAEGTNNIPRRSMSRERILQDNLSRQRSTFTDQTMQYVTSLELKIKQLEEEKKQLHNKLTQVPNIDGTDFNSMLSGRPEAVVRALQVLEVQDTLHTPDDFVSANVAAHTMQDDNSSADMDESEKALIREMCNVVWRNMDDGPAGKQK